MIVSRNAASESLCFPAIFYMSSASVIEAQEQGGGSRAPLPHWALPQKHSKVFFGCFFHIYRSFTAPPTFFPGSHWLPRFHRIHQKGVCEMSSYSKKKSCDFVVTAENTGKVLALSQRFLPDALYCFTLKHFSNLLKKEDCTVGANVSKKSKIGRASCRERV